VLLLQAILLSTQPAGHGEQITEQNIQHNNKEKNKTNTTTVKSPNISAGRVRRVRKRTVKQAM
jgi:hypothetical protein